MPIRLHTRASMLLMAGAVAAAPLVSSVPAFAQPAAPASAASAGAMPREATVDRRIATLHSQLKIMPAQETAFTAFADVMRQDATRMDAQVQKRLALPASATAVDELQAYNEMAQTHAQNMQQMVSAFSTLYDALSPAQKKLADQDFRRFATGQRTPRT